MHVNRQERWRVTKESAPSARMQSNLVILLSVPTSTARGKCGTVKQCKIFIYVVCECHILLNLYMYRCGRLPEYVMNEDEKWERVPCLHFNEIHWIHQSCNISFSLEMIYGF